MACGAEDGVNVPAGVNDAPELPVPEAVGFAEPEAAADAVDSAVTDKVEAAVPVAERAAVPDALEAAEIDSVDAPVAVEVDAVVMDDVRAGLPDKVDAAVVVREAARVSEGVVDRSAEGDEPAEADPLDEAVVVGAMLFDAAVVMVGEKVGAGVRVIAAEPVELCAAVPDAAAEIEIEPVCAAVIDKGTSCDVTDES